MFIFTAKFNKKKLIGAVICAGIILCAIVCLASERHIAALKNDLEAAQSVLLKLKSGQERMDYLTSLGWEATGDEQSKQTVIPENFDDTYEEYNKIQLDTGFDLSRYKGKPVTVYSYVISNYPSESNVCAHLIIYKNKLIGGDICSARLDGFMQGLSQRTQGNNN